MIIGLTVAGFKVWKSLEKDLTHCWNQAADGDDYAWQQKLRIDQLFTRTDNLDRQCESFANEASMALDYATGVHFAVVELGGFVRYLHGLTEEQWNRLQVEERGNVVSCNVMGSSRYLNLVRQRVRHETGVDTDERTDEPRDEEDGEAMDSDADAGEDSEEEDTEPTEVHQPAIDGRLTGLMDVLKQQQELATRAYEVKQILMIQRTSLKILDLARMGGNLEGNYLYALGYMMYLFRDVARESTLHGRESVDRYNQLAEHYTERWEQQDAAMNRADRNRGPRSGP